MMDKDGSIKTNNNGKIAICKVEKKKKNWDEDIPIPGTSYPIAVLVITICAGFCYSNSLNGDFVFDDSEAIVNNNDIRSSTPIINLFRNDFWGTRLLNPSSHKSYRPLTVLSFKLNHIIGALDPFSYHLFNLILHCVVSVVSLPVFLLVYGHSSSKAALLSSILFATHPVHTEAVAGIVGRADLLCALFVFFALLSYVKVVKEASQSIKNPNDHSYVKQFSVKEVYLCLVAVFTAIAMLCKEVGITALGLCSAYDILVAHGGLVGRILMASFFEKNLASVYWKQISDGTFRSLVSRHLFLVVLGIFLLLMRWIVMGSTVPKFMIVDNPASFLDSFIFRSLNYQYIYSLNSFLLIFPIWLCFDWSMGCIPVITSFLDARLLSLLVLWTSVAALIYRGLASQTRSSRCVLFSLALGVIPFLPASNMFFRVGFVIAERVLYIPVAGLCILIVTGIREISKANLFNKHFVRLGYLILVITFVLRSRQRSRDWLTENQLFKSGLDVCPLNAKVHYNMGKVAADEGNVSEAVERYREALRLNTDYDQAMNNLANILKDQGHLDEALFLLQRATTLRPDFAAAWMNLGIIQASLNLYDEAQKSYLTALNHRSVYPDCLYNLGNLYRETGQHNKALSTWTNATYLKPSLTVAWTNMLILLDSAKEYNKAIEVAHRALKHLPNEPALHFNLANTLGKLGQFEQSEKHFLLAINLEPGNANYWANLGVLYHRWKKYDKAEQVYRHTLQLSPDMKSAHNNLSLLLDSMGKRS